MSDGGHVHNNYSEYTITDERLSAIARNYMNHPTNSVSLCFKHATLAVIQGADVHQEITETGYAATCDVCYNSYTDMTLESLLECLGSTSGK